MRNLTPEQARELRPNDLMNPEVPEGLEDSKLPWAGHIENEIVQDLTSYWEVNSNFKAEWVAYFLTSGGSEMQDIFRYSLYMGMPEGAEKAACRNALLTDLTRQFEGKLASWMLDLKLDGNKKQRRGANEPLLLYCVSDGINEEEIGVMRVEIERAILDPDYTLITNFHFHAVELLPGCAVIAKDASNDQVEYLRSEISKAKEDSTYIPVVGFDVYGVPLRDEADVKMLDDFDEDDVDLGDEAEESKVEEPTSSGFGDPIPELVPVPEP